jgi:hypothetical protein
MTPSAPRPNSDPSTGKYRLKNAIGHPISESNSTMVWDIMSSRFRTAQNSPAGSLGTVLPLKKKKNVKCESCACEGMEECDVQDVVTVKHSRGDSRVGFLG